VQKYNIPANVVVQLVLKIDETVVTVFIELDVTKDCADDERTDFGGLRQGSVADKLLAPRYPFYFQGTYIRVNNNLF
jgi:hypothetical protein